MVIAIRRCSHDLTLSSQTHLRLAELQCHLTFGPKLARGTAGTVIEAAICFGPVGAGDRGALSHREAAGGSCRLTQLRSGRLLSFAVALGVFALVVGVVAVPRAIARDPRRRRVEPAASAQRLHCLPHSLVPRWLIVSFIRDLAPLLHPGSQASPGAPSISAASPLGMAPDAKEPPPRRGSGSSTSGLV